jgi:CheY-like chemotaxis protein
MVRRLLVIDDHAPSRVIAQLALQHGRELAVETADSGAAGLARARAAPPDAILLDVTMPGLDGPAVLAALQADPRTAGIPIVFVTAARGPHVDALRDAPGVAGVVAKPYHPRGLFDLVESLLADHRRSARPLARGSVSPPAASTAAGAVLPSRRARRPTDLRAPRPRVLVIDDDQHAGPLVVRALRRDYDVDVATSSPAALAAIRAGAQYDVILCDLYMPVLSGAELLAVLRAEHPDQAARLFIVTGGAIGPDGEAFLASMGDRVLGKPFDRSALLASLRLVTREPGEHGLRR